MICKFEDFKLEYSIPNLQGLGGSDIINSMIQSNLQDFIDEYEPRFLAMFFRDSFQAPELDYISEINIYNDLPDEEKTDADMNTLIYYLKFAIARYVAYNYFRNSITTNTTVAETKNLSQNSERTPQLDRLVKIYNDMVEVNKNIWYYIIERQYANTSDIFYPINTFNF